jgi:UDP-N-acetylmuramoyl-L-alanyl-D-glutamate--2,6-diaminopimelate ligase
MTKMLSELVPELVLTKDIAIDGICDDSRRVKTGDLYLATSGSAHDARDHVDDAIQVAAAAVCEAPFVSSHARVFEIADLQALKGPIASRFWGEPSKRMTIVGITGTNGKTSCSHFVAQALTALGRKCGVIGTLGFGFPSESLQDSGLTTPGAVELQRMLGILAGEQALAVTVEASSHGLVQGRLNGTDINLAVFTNISRDHLDYHRTYADYCAAKSQLFHWRGLRDAVINLDDEFGRQLLTGLPIAVRSISYAVKNIAADIFCNRVSYNNQGFEAELVTPWGNGFLQSSLLGEFNVSNMLAVIAVLGLAEYELPAILDAVGRLKNVRGRMDAISEPGLPQVVIDYAHTPDALEKALKTLRVNCEGQLWCVFGCGGDRDKGKRPEMGRIATSCADHTIITDDNPRTETSAAIIADIEGGADIDAVVVIKANRREAIALALQSAKNNDMVLIAGKGHEEYQEINGQRQAFSDYAEVEEALSVLRAKLDQSSALAKVIFESDI